MLSQLVYVSKREINCTHEEINKILVSCEKNNPPLDITGVLLYSETKFIQLVEGESKVIMSLYDKIKMDNRHSGVVMISLGAIKEKAFPSWHMVTKDISQNALTIKTDISKEDKIIFNEILLGKEEDGTRVLNLLKKFF